MNKEEALILWKNKEYYAEGKRGIIHVSSVNNKKYVIKTKKPKSLAPNTILKEYENNTLLNKIGVGPKTFFYDAEKDFMIREFVDGQTFLDWAQSADKDELKNFLISLLEQCKEMDTLLINKLEMTHPHKDLFVVKNEPVIIDFERCKKTNKPKNVTQICQFITSGKVLEVINKHGSLDKEKVLQLAEKYKKKFLEKKVFDIKEIKKEIQRI